MKSFKLIAIFLSSLAFQSCATSYITPGSSVNVSKLADADISELLSKEPVAKFPVNMAIARIQSSTYTNWQYRNSRQNAPNGRFSMILTRSHFEDMALEKLNTLSGIKQASTFNRLLLPYQYNSIKDLRLAAAKMKVNLLLVYTFDTVFAVDTKNFGPQNAIALGYLKNKEVKVTTTASAAVFDVQTEYLYGLAESTARETKTSNAWKKQKDVDALRLETEAKAFEALTMELQGLWTEIMNEYAHKN